MTPKATNISMRCFHVWSGCSDIYHLFENGKERTIAYTPRTLNTAEHNIIQLEKDGLSVIFGL